jgi:hypothetical protein
MQPGQSVPVDVANNMTLAVLALFFFWPTAIPALVNASKVNGLAAQGDHAAARAAADRARRFSQLSIALGLVCWAVICGLTG